MKIGRPGTSKHAVLGLMRGLIPNIVSLDPPVPIRVNAIAPGWTESGIVRRALFESVGIVVQSADVPARSAVLLMADKKRQGELIYSCEGKLKEIENGVLLKTAREVVLGGREDGDGDVLRKAMELLK